MINLQKIRELRISSKASPTRPDYVYAASGLVRLEDQLFVVADDELHLAIFDYHKEEPGTLMRLLPGDLPDDYGDRKKAKPDLESITLLQPYEHAPSGALLVVPSMSRKNRNAGLLITLDGKKLSTEQSIPINFSRVREKLDSMVDELNIEGIVISKDVVKLFHRGSKDNSRSAVFELDASRFLYDMHDEHVLSGDHVRRHREYELGEIDGVPLQFTDAVAIADDRVLFLASAEESDDAYEDGTTTGSAVGIIASDGTLEFVSRFEGTEKLEGVSVSVTSTRIDLLLVSDTDNEKKPSGLFKASISR
ncbi:MAG: hypothetical protein K2Z81_12030 [Cyanobacteria bacterium]|nr:hypothetical protein [Cyanobacteriota bacterium]